MSMVQRQGVLQDGRPNVHSDRANHSNTLKYPNGVNHCLKAIVNVAIPNRLLHSGLGVSWAPGPQRRATRLSQMRTAGAPLALPAFPLVHAPILAPRPRTETSSRRTLRASGAWPRLSSRPRFPRPISLMDGHPFDTGSGGSAPIRDPMGRSARRRPKVPANCPTFRYWPPPFLQPHNCTRHAAGSSVELPARPLRRLVQD